MEHILLLEDTYKELSRSCRLNDVFRDVFTEIGSVEQYQYLADSIYKIREAFMAQQSKMVLQIRQGELSALPLYIIQDKASSSRGSFIRWRSLPSAKTGGKAWLPFVQDKNVPVELRRKLVSAEKERILVNMHVAMLNSMLRQVTDALEQVHQLDELAKEECL